MHEHMKIVNDHKIGKNKDWYIYIYIYIYISIDKRITLLEYGMI